MTTTREILFSADDARTMERHYGFSYFVSTDRRMLLPATHIGPDRLGSISIHPSPLGDIVNWRVVNAAGELVIWSSERNAPRRTLIRAAIQAVRLAGCETRVHPGDRGPWGAGAASI